MEPVFALKWLKLLVSEDKFILVKRKAKHASPVTKDMVKIIVADLSIQNFVKSERDRTFPNEYVWIYKTTFGTEYYIKFKFIEKGQKYYLSLFMKHYIKVKEKKMTYIADYTNTYDIRGHEIKVTAPARFDDQTHEIVPDMELDDHAAKIALKKFRKTFDVVSPAQMKTLRKKWKLSQREFAKVVGWSPSTVALYEAGAVPTNGNNRLLKILIKDDKVMKEFIDESKNDEM